MPNSYSYYCKADTMAASELVEINVREMRMGVHANIAMNFPTGQIA